MRYTQTAIFRISILSLLVVGVAVPVHAQLTANAVAKTYTVSGPTPASGDIIVFDPQTNAFRLSDSENDPNIFGVVVDNPVVVLEVGTNGTPVVTAGEAVVNVTTAAGPIHAGDYIVSSKTPGKGERATEKQSYVLGVALDSFLGASSTPQNSSTVYEGSVRVLVGVGPRTIDSAASSDSAAGPLTNLSQDSSALATKVFKYLLAAIISVGTIAIAFRNFGSSIKESILSVGRNPLAKSSIQSMVIINTILIILISGAGLFVGLAVLFLPI